MMSHLGESDDMMNEEMKLKYILLSFCLCLT